MFPLINKNISYYLCIRFIFARRSENCYCYLRNRNQKQRFDIVRNNKYTYPRASVIFKGKIIFGEKCFSDTSEVIGGERKNKGDGRRLEKGMGVN